MPHVRFYNRGVTRGSNIAPPDAPRSTPAVMGQCKSPGTGHLHQQYPHLPHDPHERCVIYKKSEKRQMTIATIIYRRFKNMPDLPFEPFFGILRLRAVKREFTGIPQIRLIK